MASGFIVGDLVWAKMKGYPYWPGRIEDPAVSKKGSPKKGHQYVFFFGSKNYSWMAEETIKFHSEGMLAQTPTKKIAHLQAAIDEIVELSKTCPPRVVPDVAMVSQSPSSPKKIISSQKRLTTSAKKLGKKQFRSESLGKDEASVSVRGDGEMKVPAPSDTDIVRPPTSLDEGPTLMDLHPPSCSSVASGEVTPTSEKQYHPPSNRKIGFLGLGLMGRGIVKNLLASGHHVTVWNRTAEKCDPFVVAGAVKAETPADVVQASDITFCCVSDAVVVKTLIFSHMGVLKGLEGCVSGEKGYVEMTSILPDTSVEICEAITRKGCKYLEAPICGTVRQAYEGRLLALGSGDVTLFKECEPCFHAFSRHAYFISCNVGESFKYHIVINSVLGMAYGALAESLVLVERCKLASKDFVDILDHKGFSLSVVLEKAKSMADDDYTCEAALDMTQEAMEMALKMSHEHQQPLHISSAANEVYKQSIQHGDESGTM